MTPNYNYFDELVISMIEQGLMKFVDIGDGKKYINLIDVLFIQKIEKEMKGGQLNGNQK